MALEVARGLQFLHGAGVVHRDLKADNVLLDAHGHAKIGSVSVCLKLLALRVCASSNSVSTSLSRPGRGSSRCAGRPGRGCRGEERLLRQQRQGVLAFTLTLNLFWPILLLLLLLVVAVVAVVVAVVQA